MKHLLFVLAVTLVAGCSDPQTPPVDLISKESKLPVTTTDSVEYYQLSERDIWDFGQRTSFRTIIYFDDQAYETILQQVKQDPSYSVYQNEKETAKSFSIYLKKYLSPVPKCSMEKEMFLYNAKKFETIVFCNRVYFHHYNISPFD